MENIENIMSIDVGTEYSGYCILNSKTYALIDFGKVENECLLEKVKKLYYDVLVYEKFVSFGMPIGQSTIESIQWNGRYIQSALDVGAEVFPITRKMEKINICGSMKAKDANIRQALIDRFAVFDFKNGKGTKKNKDWFYGVSKDVWSAIAIGVTYLDIKKGDYEYGE